MTEKQNYYREYLEELDTLLEEFCRKAKQNYADAFSLGNYSIEKSIQNRLWLMLQHSNYRLKYNQSRCQGQPASVARQPATDLLNSLLPAPGTTAEIPATVSLPANLQASYQSLRNRLVFYCKNLRLFQYLLPVIEAISEPVIILSKTKLPDHIIPGDSVTQMTLSEFYLFPSKMNILLNTLVYNDIY